MRLEGVADSRAILLSTSVWWEEQSRQMLSWAGVLFGISNIQLGKTAYLPSVKQHGNNGSIPEPLLRNVFDSVGRTVAPDA